jgi:hypothetical protein
MRNNVVRGIASLTAGSAILACANAPTQPSTSVADRLRGTWVTTGACVDICGQPMTLTLAASDGAVTGSGTYALWYTVDSITVNGSVTGGLVEFDLTHTQLGLERFRGTIDLQGHLAGTVHELPDGASFRMTFARVD